MKTYSILFFTFLSITTYAQNPLKPTPAADRLHNSITKERLSKSSLVKNVPFTNIGPSIMSGRVVDVAVSPTDPTHFYVAYASGGLWFTNNNGISFTPCFDNEVVMTIGDIAVDWTNNIIYIGTGENNSSRSSYSGVGIYKSNNNGKTWQHIGLAESHHIGRIVLHPTQPQTLWVAAIGHLYSTNKERGIFKTTDGGKTWQHTLYIDDTTGCIDLTADAFNPNILYAAAWHRHRQAWNFVESGATSGVYKSDDGGITWKALTIAGSGFPQGAGNGRIGLATSKLNSNVVYAVIDNQAARPAKKPEKGLNKDTLRNMSQAQFLNVSDSLIDAYLDKNDFPQKYNATYVKQQIRDGKIKPIALVHYIEDANTALFDTEVTGAEVYKSTDAGIHWTKQNLNYLDEIFYTYGYFFGQIVVSPFDDNEIYIGGVRIIKSLDGGKTFKSIDADNMHSDFHAYYINPNKRNHLIIGNDGGINISYDGGKTYTKCNTPPVGQFYAVTADNAKPYNVYGGLQDNGVWYGPSNYKAGYGWYDSGAYPYKFLLGGDGMQTQVDRRDNNVIYTGFQFGFYYRMDKNGNNAVSIQPTIELGERPLRFNWQTPIALSHFNQDILYLGSNKLHRSFDKGNTWKAISPDLTQGSKKGDVAYGTLTTISESARMYGLLYTGSDDGLIHVSADGGNTWKKIIKGLPENLWVSRIVASKHADSVVYCTLNAYRFDNYAPLIYRSNNLGNTWQRIFTDLPFEAVNVIREDEVNPAILYVGTDNGLYVSLNEGKTSMSFNNGLPAVAVHDLFVQADASDIIVATHGRSLYKASLKFVQQLHDSVTGKPLHVFQMDGTMHSKRWGSKNLYDDIPYNTPNITIPYYSKTAGIRQIKIYNADSLLIHAFADTAVAGLNYAHFDASVTSNVSAYADKNYLSKPDTDTDGKIYVVPATYKVVVSDDINQVITKWVVKERKQVNRSERNPTTPGEINRKNWRR
ncbi:MAG TPA: glycosyl hydrolase [Bacteroidia bacterium]|nr:glycosyl hydrolase [Bacteroidia bacterium]